MWGVKVGEGMKEKEKLGEGMMRGRRKGEMGEDEGEMWKEEIVGKGVGSGEEYGIVEKYRMGVLKGGREMGGEGGVIVVERK